MEFNTQHQPPAPGPDLPIIRIGKNEHRHFVILSQSMWGVWTHWAGDRSEPCFAEKKDCPGCKRGLPRRWKGYLHAHDRQRGKECFVELTPLSAESLLSQAGDGQVLRGLRVQLKRTQAHNGRLLVLVDPGVAQIAPSMEAKDPVKVLARLWGVAMLERQSAKEGLKAIFPDAEAG